MATEPFDATATLTFNLGLAWRLAAKVALGALARAQLDEVWSPLGDRLRDILWERLTPIRTAPINVLEMFTVGHIDPGALLPPIIPPAPSTPTEPPSRAVLMPFGDNTVVYVFLGPHALGFSGFCVPAPFALGRWAAGRHSRTTRRVA